MTPEPYIVPSAGFHAEDLMSLIAAAAPTVIVLVGLLLGGCQ